MSSYSSLSSSISAVPSPRAGSAVDTVKSNRSDSQSPARQQKREQTRPALAASAGSSSRSSIQKLRRERTREETHDRQRERTPFGHAVVPSSSKAPRSFPSTPTRSRTPRPSSPSSYFASSGQFKLRNPQSIESLVSASSPGHDLSDLDIDIDRKASRNRNRNISSIPVALKFRGYAALGGPSECNEADVDAASRSLRASVQERPVHTGFQAHQSIIASRSSTQPVYQVSSGSSSGSFSSPKPILQVPASPRRSTPSPSLTPQRHLSPATARLLRNTTSSLVREASTSSLRTSAVPSPSSSFSETPSTPSPPSRVLKAASYR